MFLKENGERITYFKMKKLKTRNIVGYKFRLKDVSLQAFLTVVQLFIVESPFEVYSMISCYYIHDSKLLYVSDI